jgi:hypothetical protein
MRDKYDDLGDYVIAYLQETPKHRFDTVTKLGVPLRVKDIKVPQNDLAPKAKVRISAATEPTATNTKGKQPGPPELYANASAAKHGWCRHHDRRPRRNRPSRLRLDTPSPALRQ